MRAARDLWVSLRLSCPCELALNAAARRTGSCVTYFVKDRVTEERSLIYAAIECDGAARSK